MRNDRPDDLIITQEPCMQTLMAIEQFARAKRGMTAAQFFGGLMRGEFIALYQKASPQNFAIVGFEDPDLHFGEKVCHVHAISSDTSGFMSLVSRKVFALARIGGCKRITAESDTDDGYAKFMALGRGHEGIERVRPYKISYQMKLDDDG